MAIRTVNSCCGNDGALVEHFIGTAYDVVKTVYDNLGILQYIYDFLNQHGVLVTVDSVDELKALNTDMKYARVYTYSNAAGYGYTDYLYVEGNDTGVIPNDPDSTGTWVVVASSSTGGNGNAPAYIPYVYAQGSALGGETTIAVPNGTVGVPFIIIEGHMNTVGYGFTFDTATLTVTLAQPLEVGDEVVLLLTGTPAVPDNPNISDWVTINWLYNGGYAVGGEQVIAVPYTFEAIPAIYKNGDRYYAGLANKSYTVDAANQRILLTEPLATNDRLIVQIGGESTTFIMSDRTVQEVARSANVSENEVILSTNATQYLNGMKVIYDVVEQKGYLLPALPTNVYINSVSNGKLTYSPGNITVDLLPFMPTSMSDDMAASGIGTLSGKTLQEELNGLIGANAVPKDVFIGSFFNSNADVSLTLVKSFDGKNFSVMNKKPVLLPTGAKVGNRDPSIVFYKGEWWFSTTGGGDGTTGRDFDIWRSKDLISWDYYQCNAGNGGLYGKPGSTVGGTIEKMSPLWAPSLFVDNGNLYVQLSVSVHNRAPDQDGTDVNFMAPFSIRLADADTMTFDPAISMMSTAQWNVQRIDVEITKLPDGYLMLIKNEYNKRIELWKSSTYISGYTKIGELDFGGRYVEGPACVYINHLSTYRIYADAFFESGVTWYVDTKDFQTFTTPERVQCPNPLRHGTVYNIANCAEAEAALGTFVTAAATMSTDHLNPKWAEGGLANGATTLVPQENYVYRVSGNSVATVTVNEKGGDYFYLLVGSGYDSAGIVLQGSKVDGGPYTLGFGQTNLTLVEVKYNEQSSLYQVSGGMNDRSSVISLNTLGGWPNLGTAWVPKHNAIYTTNGAMAETIINGISTIVPDGTFFYLWIGSGANGGKVTFKAGGTGVALYNRDLTLSGAMGHGDTLHKVTKVGGYWRVTVSGPTDFEYAPLINRKAYFVGDSITIGSPGASYAPYLCESLSMTLVQNAAVGGAKMADGVTQISTLPATIPEDGVVFVALGTNDFRGNTTLGVPTDGMSGSATTFYRHCQLVAQALLPKLGTATRVYFISPLASSFNSTNTSGKALRDYAEAIEQTCQAFGFGFLNGAYVSQLNLANMAALTTDNLHPNGAGAAYIGRNYARFLRNSGM